MLGVPTQSDVLVSEYRILQIERSLLDNAYFGITPPHFIKEHVHYALKATEDPELRKFADKLYNDHTDTVNWRSISKRAESHLDPKTLLYLFENDIKLNKHRIACFKSNLDSLEREYLKHCDTLKLKPPKITRNLLTLDFWNIAYQKLDSLKNNLENSYNLSDIILNKNRHKKLCDIDNVISKFTKDIPNGIRLSKFDTYGREPLLSHNDKAIREMEYLHPIIVNARDENKRMRARSDLTLDFNEDKFVGGNHLSLNADGILNSNRWLFGGLCDRTKFRDEIVKKLEEKEEIVINGISYVQHGNFIELLGDHNYPKNHEEILNAMPMPVVYKGKIIPHDRWALDESKLVDKFKKGDIDINTIETRYIVDYSDVHLEQLRRKRFDSKKYIERQLGIPEAR